MPAKRLPVLGVLGGMGPLATADFFFKLIQNMPAEIDQQHNRVIIDSNTQIPDRVSAILQGTTDPSPELLHTLLKLENYGVDLIAVPCHTITPFLESIKREITVPVMDMVSTMVNEIQKRDIRKVGILASQGVFRLNIYSQKLQAMHIDTIQLTEEQNQNLVEPVRIQVKTGRIDPKTSDLLNEAIRILHDKGAEKVALCCSDLPLALNEPLEKILDANLIFALKVIEQLQFLE
ncbi:MAG: amino acid racemase [Caldithrix sp.]|nr:amino acid racemase [Caldithrix sp.]